MAAQLAGNLISDSTSRHALRMQCHQDGHHRNSCLTNRLGAHLLWEHMGLQGGILTASLQEVHSHSQWAPVPSTLPGHLVGTEKCLMSW